ncbi:MAG: ATP-binding cassette domain-containing protein, partial [Deltaproteobacteria bacterium]|nr:ATP-binding cassette domain-containing protein [Deltaproteobacteria bacterium]
MALLEIAGLDVHYGGIHALKGVSLKVEAGEVVTLIGANGAGKTTTLRAISGLLKPSRGTVTFDGQAITGVAPHLIVGRGLIHAPEGRGIFSNMTVDENLAIGAFLRKDRVQVGKDRAHALDLFPR